MIHNGTQKVKRAVGIAFVALFVLTTAAPAAGAATIAAPPRTGLVGSWKFDEGAGTRANDSSGLGRSATLFGATLPTWTMGKLGKALSFDGTDDRVVSNNTMGISGNAEYTISAWVYPTNSSPGAYQEIANISAADVANQCASLGLYNGKLAAGFCTNGVYYNSSSALAVNQWYHLVVVKNAGTILANTKLYLNGVLVSNTILGSDGTPNITDSTITIGRFGPASSAFFKGTIDDARIYNRAISAAEIAVLYKDGATAIKSPNNTGLVGAWKFDEGTGTRAGDSSGLGNIGTLINSPTWTTGKLGKALSLNGGYATILDSPVLNPTAAVSISVWAKINTVSIGQAVSKYDSVSALTPYEIQFWNDGKIYGNFKTTGGGIGSMSCSYSANTWYHIVSTYDGFNGRLYLNGVQCSTQAAVGTIISAAKNLYIGSSGGAGLFNGSIDDVRVYNRALSAAEITALYKSTAAVVNASTNTSGGSLTSGLVGLWSFDGKDVNWSSATAGTALDRSGQGNTGTLTNMSRSTSPAIGKIGQALKFDGTSSYVTMNNATGIPTGNADRTLSVWIKPSGVGTTDMQPALWLGSSLTHNISAIGIRTAGNFLTMTFWADELDSTVVATNGQWFHLVGTYVGATRAAKLYVNGTLAASKTLASDINTPANVYISSSPDSRRIKAALDDARVYNRALSATEIKSLYNLGR